MKNSFKMLLVAVVLLLSACTAKEPPKKPLVWVDGWKETSSLAEQRAGAAVVEANGYIYMMAGLDGNGFLKTVEYAKIQEDGSLGPWKSGPSLNVERAWLEGVVYNGNIYVVGGANNPEGEGVYASNLLASVERAKINPDGSLSPWVVEKNSMVVPRRCNKVAILDNHMYAIGGYAMVMLDSVEHTDINEDGSVGEWILEPKSMLVPHYVNGVKAKKGGLYVFAGHAHMDGVGLTNVEWAKIQKDGGLGPWKNTSPLQTGRHGLASASHGDNFYVLGGFTGTEFLDSVEKTTLQPDGTLSPWVFTTPLGTNRMNYSAVVYKDWIYVLSGTNGSGYLKSVEYATFNDKGDIGFQGTEEDLAAYKKKVADKMEAKRLASSDEELFEGVVVSLLRTEGYSYIEVALQDGNVWLAISDPKIKLAVNDRIRFGYGLYMPNFYSKQLQRYFSKLFFMKGVRKAK